MNSKNYKAPAGGRKKNNTQPHGFQRIQSAILFLDVKGYSSLSEDEVERFVGKILPQMAKVASNYGYDYLNTWGDAVVVAGQDTKKVASIALEFRDLFRKCDWGNLAIPPLQLRISLHAGEIYRGDDVFSAGGMISGRAVNLAARIEPIVEPGQIWASKDFIQLLSRQDQGLFKWAPLGPKKLPKDAGIEELSVIFWSHEPNPLERGKEAAVTIVRKNGMVLLVRRIDSGKPIWQFPAGQVKPSVDPAKTAVSEVRSETGIECTIVEKVNERMHPDTNVYIHYFLADWVSGEPSNLDPEENDEVEWSTPAAALDKFKTDVDLKVKALLQTLTVKSD